MKRFITLFMAALLFVMPSFAYDGFKFNEGGKSPKDLNVYCGSGVIGTDTFLFKEFNIDESKLTEVVVDRDAYCLLYNISRTKDGKELDWCIIEATDFIGVKRYTGWWTEYHLYKKVKEL